MGLVYAAQATAAHGEHTPNASLDAAMLWLSRTPTGYADCVLLTMPGRLHAQQEVALYDEIQRALGESRPLFIWGKTEGLARSGWEIEHIIGDLSLCYCGWDRPSLRSDVILPAVAIAGREFPPVLLEECIKASCGEHSVILDIFPRAPHIAVAVAGAVGARVLSVGPVVDQHIQAQSSVPVPFWAKSKDFADVFQSRLVKSGMCLIYRGKPNKDGYARLKIGGHGEHYAHRVAYQIEHKCGLPEGVPILHASCPDKRCCLPAHLRAGSTDTNLQERWVNRRNQK